MPLEIRFRDAVHRTTGSKSAKGGTTFQINGHAGAEADESVSDSSDLQSPKRGNRSRTHPETGVVVTTPSGDASCVAAYNAPVACSYGREPQSSGQHGETPRRRSASREPAQNSGQNNTRWTWTASAIIEREGPRRLEDEPSPSVEKEESS